tara:strand:- start:2077 stop:3390 length:1314 start_codon:yes stop_codon:yes gene_type:complete
MTATATQPFWRMEDPELDAGGQIVRGGMWSHQRDWWELPNFVKALVTGYGGGKTMALAKRMVYLALYNSPAPVMTVSPSYPLAAKTIVQSIDELLEGRCTIEPQMTYTLRKSQPYEFTIRLGGRTGLIWCMSGERPDRLKGPNIGAAGIDEPFIQPVEVYNQVVARVRHPAARIKEICLTGTPEGVIGWGFDLCEGEGRDRQDVGVVQASTSNNKALGAEYVQRMEAAYDDAALAAYRDGKFVNMTTGRVYHSFDPTVHVTDEEMPSGAELCVGMDFNVCPMSYVVFWRKGDRMHVVAEYEKPNSDAEEVGHYIRQDHPQVRKIYPDASGNNRQNAGGGHKSAFAYLREQGYQICARSKNPSPYDRMNSVNGGLRHGRVTISSKCRKLRSYLLGNTHKDRHTKAQEAMSHLLDAFGYPIHYLYPVDRQTATTTAFRY